MTPDERIATLERIVAVLGEEVARLNDENDALRARLAMLTNAGEELAREGLPS